MKVKHFPASQCIVADLYNVNVREAGGGGGAVGINKILKQDTPKEDKFEAKVRKHPL